MILWSEMRPRTVVSQACGSMPLSWAFPIRVEAMAADLPPPFGADGEVVLAAECYGLQGSFGTIVDLLQSSHA